MLGRENFAGQNLMSLKGPTAITQWIFRITKLHLKNVIKSLRGQ